jgi:hypothetical protein
MISETGKSDSRPLSDFWRRRRSESLEAELGTLLRAARGYASFFSPEITVNWSSSEAEAPGGSHIVLDFAPLDGKVAPFHGSDVDRVMGRALEDCAKYAWSYPHDRIREYYRSRCANPLDHQLPRGYHPRELRELETVAAIIESYFVGRRLATRFPALQAYVTEARRRTLERRLPPTIIAELSDDTTSFDAIVTAWGAHLLNDTPLPGNLSPITAVRLRQLVQEAVEHAGDDVPEHRIALAYRIWQMIRTLPRAEDKDDSLGEARTRERPILNSGQHHDTAADGTLTQGRDSRDELGNESAQWPGEQDYSPRDTASPKCERLPNHAELRPHYRLDIQKRQPLRPGVKASVDRWLHGNREDITESVSEVFGVPPDRSVTIELAEPDPEKARQLETETRATAEQLSHEFERDKRLRTRPRRGLEEGHVSTRHLARAGARDYRTFERKEVLNAPSLAVGILVDASGSMTHERLDRALGIAMALKTALGLVRSADLMVAAYNSDSQFGSYCQQTQRLGDGKPWLNWMLRDVNCGGTMIYRIYDCYTGGFRAGIQTIGGTPSGESIAGMVSQIGKYLHGKSRMIIHITDGVPDSDDAVKRAVKYCRERNIDVLTLTLHRLDEKVKDAYDGLVEYVEVPSDLPRVVAKMMAKCLDKRLLQV